MILTHGGRIADWQEAHLKVPEGARFGEYLLLLPWQRKVLYEIYNNKGDGTHITLATEVELFESLLMERDRVALLRELDRCRATSRQRWRQLASKREQMSELRLAAFAAYINQHTALKLKPHDMPPCYMAHPDEYPGGKLLRRVVERGASKFDTEAVVALVRERA
jgi:hypothetical protein